MTSINTNISAFFAQANLKSAQGASSNQIARLSSGERIVRAADDVAGLSIGTILSSTVNSLKTALSNTQQANSLLQIADGGLDNITSILQRQKSLSVQATAGTLSASERGFLNQEFQNLSDEINRLVDNTKFNSVSLLDGSIFDDAAIRTDDRVIGACTANSAVLNQPVSNGTIIALKEGVNANEIDTFFNAVNSAAVGSAAINTLGNGTTTGVFNNAAFVGDLGGAEFNVEFTGTAGQVNIDITVGDITYRSANVTATGACSATFSGLNNVTGLAQGSFQLNMDAGVTLVDAQDAEVFEAKLNGMLDKVTFYQARTMEGDFSGLVSGATARLRLDNFEDTFVSDVRVQATDGTKTGFIEIDVKDETTGETTTFRNTIALTGTVAAGENLFTQNATGLTEQDQLVVNLAATVGLTINNVANAAALEKALEEAFRVGTGASGLTFQTGSSISDTIDVKIKGLDTNSLYEGKALSVLTVEGAQEASTQLDKAINAVTAIRADVGALQSRFDFAGANLETSIQNQDAAKSLFLDADISAESTNFAQSQVKLQASIAVLAQANLQPQNLLKLIG